MVFPWFSMVFITSQALPYPLRLISLAWICHAIFRSTPRTGRKSRRGFSPGLWPSRKVTIS